MEPTTEMAALKTRLKAVWESGDYDNFSNFLKPGAMEFFDRLDIPAGTKLLDIGCGSGQLSIPAARRGIDVTAIDLAQNLVDKANEYSRAEGLDIRIEQGDAEDLQFGDGEFDIALSLIGSMFAPRPELVASEMLRVVKPGGKVIMGNWTPAGHVGQFFKVIGKFAPPPPIFPSPMLWGDPGIVRERFGDGVSDLRMTTYYYPMILSIPPREVTDFFIDYYGPTNRAFASLDEENKSAFKDEFTAVWERNNQATDGTTNVPAEYIEVVGTKA
ncbi:MAG: class I SAM-dependent methyltransferase [Armatimonadota bacterium]|nr:class I SAM-dependent methyltransferase [Armatimonadota bacterium]